MSNPHAEHNEKGKANFDHVYDLPGPRGYFVTLGALDYRAPEHGSRVFEGVFDRTVDWAVGHGIETATFHILTPYPGRELYARLKKAGRIVHSDWDLYDTRRVAYHPARLSPEALEEGYWRAYKNFYRWGNILREASTEPTLHDGARHVAYSGGWKKLEPMWD